MGEPSFSEELSLFAKDLFADLMSRHPLFYMLPRKPGGSRYFKSEMSKFVLLEWHRIRKKFQPLLRNNFLRFTRDKDSFEEYLKFLVGVTMGCGDNTIIQIVLLSAVLLEIIGFVHRRGMTHYVRDAPTYLHFMLSNVKSDKFYELGGWRSLALAAVLHMADYDENEIRRDYLSESVSNFGPLPTSFGETSNTLQESVAIVYEPSGVEDAKNFQPPEDFSETSSEISEKTFSEVMAIVNELSWVEDAKNLQPPEDFSETSSEIEN